MNAAFLDARRWARQRLQLHERTGQTRPNPMSLFRPSVRPERVAHAEAEVVGTLCHGVATWKSGMGRLPGFIVAARHGRCFLQGMAKPAPPNQSAEAKRHFFELLKEFDTATVVTRPADGSLHGRPLSIAAKDDDGTLWFVTSVESPKVKELLQDARTLVVLQGGSRYAVAEGTAGIVRDRAKIEELWSEGQRVWFENKDDPDIALVRFSPVSAEYWDNAGAQGIKFAFHALKAVVTGQPLTDRGDPKQHGKVSL